MKKHLKKQQTLVFYRIYPSDKTCLNKFRIEDDTKKIFIKSTQTFTKKQLTVPFWEFQTDGVFINSTQEKVIEAIVNDIPDVIFEGCNIIITAFGQTGSGKTFTITNLENRQNLGIIPNVITKIFTIKNTLPPNIKMAVELTYLDFSKSYIADLLKPFPNYLGVWNAAGATKIKVKNKEDAFKFIYIAEGRKNVVKTEKYLSNLNTSVLTLYVTTKDFDFSNAVKIQCRLHIIDMAGVDNCGNSTCYAKKLADVGCSNVRMAFFERFFNSLNDRAKSSVIHKRDDPFLYFLGKDLSASTYFRFIGHIRVTDEDLRITLSMLKFGQTVKKLKPSLTSIAIEESIESKLGRLQMEMEEIKKGHMQNSILLNQDLSVKLTEERTERMRQLVRAYLKDNVKEIRIFNVEDAIAVFQLFKNLFEENCPSRVFSLGEPDDLKSFSTKSKRSTVSMTNRPTSKIDSIRSDVIKKLKELESNVLDDNSTGKKTDNISRKSAASQARRGSGSRQSSKTAAKLSKKNSSKGSDKVSLVTSETLPHPYNSEVYDKYWSDYINDGSYKRFIKKLDTNRDNLKETCRKYLESVGNFLDLNEEFEMKKKDICEMKLHLNFEIIRNFEACSDDFSEEYGNVEDEYQRMLNDYKTTTRELKEKVLSLQSMLKLHLEIREMLKLQLNEEFRSFCNEKFQTNLPPSYDVANNSELIVR